MTSAAQTHTQTHTHAHLQSKRQHRKMLAAKYSSWHSQTPPATPPAHVACSHLRRKSNRSPSCASVCVCRRLCECCGCASVASRRHCT